jgi:hypothetical protein
MKNTKYGLIALIGSFLSLIPINAYKILIDPEPKYLKREQNNGVDLNGNTDLHDYVSICDDNFKIILNDAGILSTLKYLNTKNENGETPKAILAKKLRDLENSWWPSSSNKHYDCKHMHALFKGYEEGYTQAQKDNNTN